MSLRKVERRIWQGEEEEEDEEEEEERLKQDLP